MAVIRRWYKVEALVTRGGKESECTYVIEAPGPNEARRAVKERLGGVPIVENYRIKKVMRADEH